MLRELSRSQRCPLGSVSCSTLSSLQEEGLHCYDLVGGVVCKASVFKNLGKPLGLSLGIQLLSLVSKRFHLAPSPARVRTGSEWGKEQDLG